MELNRSVVYLAQYHHLFPQFEINFSAKNVDPLLTKFYMWQRSCWCLLNSPLLLSVSSPPCEKRGEVLSTSTESGSVIIDVVRQSNPPEGVGAAFHDTGTRSIIDNVKLLSKVYEMAVKGWRVGSGYVMNAWNLAFETINAFATVTSFLGSFRFCSFISRVPRLFSFPVGFLFYCWFACRFFFHCKGRFFWVWGRGRRGGVCLLFCPNCYYSGSEFRVPNIVKRKQE